MNTTITTNNNSNQSPTNNNNSNAITTTAGAETSSQPPLPIKSNNNEISTSSKNGTTTTKSSANANKTNTTTLQSHELESQFILRMPIIKQPDGSYKMHDKTKVMRELFDKHQTTLSLTKDKKESGMATVQNLPDPLKDRLFIEMNTDTRKGRVKFDDEVFEARLVDLPCIIESLKTLDRKSFYKIANICQMLVCRTVDDDPWSPDEAENESEKKPPKKPVNNGGNDYDLTTNPVHARLRKYQWPHGITPPLKNVRRKRFRKVAKKKIVDYADIEKEVKQLFRADREAVKIEYEVAFVEPDSADLLLIDNGENDDDDDEDETGQGANGLSKHQQQQQEKYGGLDLDEDSQDDMSMSMSMMSRGATPASKLAANAKATPAAGLQPQKKDSLSNSNANAKDSTNNSNLNTSDTLFEAKQNQSSTIDDASKSGAGAKKGGEGGESSNPQNMMSDTNDGMSNSPGGTGTGDKKESRTSFKNLFVKQVIGDLSSSEDSDDDEDGKEETTSIKPSAGHAGYESGSNMDAEMNDDDDLLDESDSNLESATTTTNMGVGGGGCNIKSKLTFNDTLNDQDQEDDDSSMINEDEVSQAGAQATTSAATTSKQIDDDFNNISLSSSSEDSDGESPVVGNQKNQKAELAEKLNGLLDELDRIKEERRRREQEVQSINNMVLKKHLSSKLDVLIEEETRKAKEIDELKLLLND